ncbi:hypothetical protein BDZ94DRAFT_1315716 [Collybia nuda]|uniref:Acetoin reductase family protein n=1 Tax=Collybia nuda TaxID=64659 RepID=A0A9P6CCA2_9AGAR|nr:hypothetical protein BDZ94DRAFT_1315716 [Collybia nuda]
MTSKKGIVLVTGAGQGIGRAIALRLADDGYDVAVNDISTDNLESLVEDIRLKGRLSSMHKADVSVEDQVRTMIENVRLKIGGGRFFQIVANAGIAKWKTIDETTGEDWDEMFSVNAKGTFFCYKYAGRQMIAQGRGGRIIGACSVSGKKGSAGLAAYCGSKFAMRGLTQAAAAEFGPHKITVNAYAPGAIETALLNGLDADVVERSRGEKAPGDWKGLISTNNSLGYQGTTAEIASLVSYLASKESHFITGQTISCNGGSFFD